MDLADAQAAFRDDLLNAGLLIATSSIGLYGRSGTFERIVDGIDNMVREAGADQAATVLRFPPIIPRDVFEGTDYIASFPNLTGAIFTFAGDDQAHAGLLSKRAAGEDWSSALTPSDLMLASAACHPVYPTLHGTLPESGRKIDVLGFCFRREPAIDPARLQAFRMHEYVYIGTPAEARAHRQLWIDRALEVVTDLGLEARAVTANDPFFGRAGRVLAANQREEDLKTEIVVRLYGDGPEGGDGTACASANCHVDHFGLSFGIRTADGAVAHSACVGFGLERLALALLRTHGLDVERWPVPVRRRLWS